MNAECHGSDDLLPSSELNIASPSPSSRNPAYAAA